MSQKIDFSNIAKTHPTDELLDEIQPGRTNPDSFEENLRYLKKEYSEKILFGIEETSMLLGQSYESIRRRIKSGQISSTSFGNRKMVHRNELARIITEGF